MVYTDYLWLLMFGLLRSWFLLWHIQDVVEFLVFLLIKLIPESLAATIVQYQGIFLPWLYWFRIQDMSPGAWVSAKNIMDGLPLIRITATERVWLTKADGCSAQLKYFRPVSLQCCVYKIQHLSVQLYRVVAYSLSVQLHSAVNHLLWGLSTYFQKLFPVQIS